MSNPQGMSDPRLFEFWSQLLRDLESGDVPPLEHYVARFPGLESDIEREYRQALDRVRAGDPCMPTDVEEGDDHGPGADPLDSFLDRLSRHPPRAGRYGTPQEIARGGMGIIHQTFDHDLRRPIALKTTRHTNQRSLAAFLDEAQITGQLDHPGIVPVHELGVDARGNVYFTMRLVKGRTLADVFRLVEVGDANWTQTRALNVILRVCEAMAYAHSKGVIHRDLKPANVMCGEFGEVYVMDWGLARVLDTGHESRDGSEQPRAGTTTSVRTLRTDEIDTSPASPLATQAGDVLGTPNYMPPELASGELVQPSARSDVYSVGAILYQLLARRPPYAIDGPRAEEGHVLKLVLQGPPKPLISLRSDLPAELVAVCEKAMSRDPSARYPQMSAMADDLRAFLEQRVVGAYRVGAWQEFKKWCARNRATAAVAGFATLLAIGTIAALWRSLDLLDERNLALQAAANEKATSVAVHSTSKFQSEPGTRAEIMRSCAQAEFELAQLESELADRAFVLDPRDSVDRELKERVTNLAREARTWSVIPHVLRQNAGNACPADADGWPSALGSGALEDECARTTGFVNALAGAAPEAWSTCLARAKRREARARMVRAGVTGSRFPSPESRDDHDHLVSFVERLAEFTDPDPHVGVASVLMEEPGRRTISDLVALGVDPRSGMQEFALAGTGTIPVRRVDGSLELDENSAVVLVLVSARPPASESTSGEPAALAGTDFYASKDELTLGQWLRAGNLPPTSGIRAWATLSADQRRVALMSPVVDVSWREAALTLRRRGLRLPSGAEWRRLGALQLEMVSDRSPAEGNTSVVALAPDTARALGAFAGESPIRRSQPGIRGLDRLPAEWLGDAWRPFEDSPGHASATPSPTKPSSSQRLRRVGGLESQGESPASVRAIASEEDRFAELGIRPVRPLDP